MSIVERPAILPLTQGQRLKQPEFHERYSAMPEGTWAELIGGEVFMSSPVVHRHGVVSGNAVTWLNLYKYRTPGVQVGENSSTILSDENEVQPDALMRILPDRGGQATIGDRIIQGAPELVVEVSFSSRYMDLGRKKLSYEKAGAREYLVFAIDPDEAFWHVLEGDRLIRVAPDPDGIYRSRVFPGLWLDPVALFEDDGPKLMATLDRGLASAEHGTLWLNWTRENHRWTSCSK